MKTIELVYPGFDNTTKLLLKAGGIAYNLQDITKMEVYISGQSLSSNNGVGDPIRWNQQGQAVGEVEIIWGEGSLSLITGAYLAYLVVVDTAHPEGLVWDEFQVKVTVIT